MDQEVNSELSPEETAYIESGGEGEIPAGSSEGTPKGTPAAEGTAPGENGTPPPAEPAKTVPLAALHQERERRKKLENDLAEERRQRGVIETRTNLILERFAKPPEQPKAEEPKIPELGQDPLGHLTAKNALLERQIGELTNASRQTEEQRRIQDGVRQIEATAQAMEQEFKSKTPDYDQAVAHLVTTQQRELALQGLSPAQIQQSIRSSALQVAALALQNGRNPAEILYEAAKIRGYAVPAATHQNGAPNNNGASMSSESQAAENGAKIANLQTAQNQNGGLGNSRGSAPVPLTAERLLAMSDAEFDAAMKTEAGRSLMGV